ncbi:MAG: AI-2E family transporter [Propionibacteriaceae bacterium]|nr:AI-2E family transporter [Propionibacteriaceae bacterium]
MAFVNPEDQVPDSTLPAPKSSVMPRALSVMLGVAAFFIAAQGIQPIQSTIAAAFMALNLVIVVWPIQRVLAKHIPRFLASLISGLVAFGMLAALIWSIGWTIARLIQELPKYSPQFNNMMLEIRDFASRYNIDTNAVVSEALVQLRGLIPTIVSTLVGITSSLTSVVGLILMILMILIFMVFDSAGFSDRMKRLGERHNPTLAWALDSFAKGTRKYWVVTTVFGLIVAVCNWMLLLGLGVPMAFIWALFSFVTNYIPNIGFIIGIIPPVMMALLANDPLTAVWVVVGYFVFNTFFQTFIQPKIAGDAVGITPTMAVLSLLVWAYILGPLGAILAIPATLLVKSVLVDIDPNTRWLNAFIASNPTTSDQDPIRLSNLLERAKKIRKLTARAQKLGAKPEDVEAAHRELAALADADEDQPIQPPAPDA